MKTRFFLLIFVIIVVVIIVYKLRSSSSEVQSSVLKTDEIIEVPARHQTKSESPLLLIKVFYEVLCPDSKHFIVKQLHPAWAKLKSINATHLVHVDLVPYGKASSRMRNGKFSFECQHGEEECRLNRIHSCVIANKALDFDTVLDKVKCSISRPAFTEECGLSDCGNGDELLYANGQVTSMDLGRINFVPTISVNQSQKNQADLLKNFYAEIITQLKVAFR